MEHFNAYADSLAMFGSIAVALLAASALGLLYWSAYQQGKVAGLCSAANDLLYSEDY